MNRSIRAIVIATAGALLAGAAWAQSTTQPAAAPSTSSTAKFAKAAAIGGMEEVELGRIATQNATNARVKEFGQKMVDDHTKANGDLKQAASQDGIDVPSELDAKHKAEMEKFRKMSGAAFDKAYMADMVKDHKKDVAEFERAAKSRKDSAVKKFAEDTLPTLREHLKMAQDVHKEVGGRMMGSHKKSTAKTSGSSD